MALASGTKLGSYEVVTQIGAGGMGEVYQAHDTKLGRDVAIKVLPEAFAHDPDTAFTISTRSQDARFAESSQHRNNSRTRTIWRHELSGHGVGIRRNAGGASQDWPGSGGRSAENCGPDCGSARSCARKKHYSPRPEAMRM